MSDSRSSSMHGSAPVAWSVLILAVAPFMAWIQKGLKEYLGDSFRPILITGLLLVAIGSLIWAASRIREHAGARWSALAFVVILLAVQLLFFRRSDAQTDLSEKIHILEYGMLAFLVYRVSRPSGDRRQIFLPLLWVALVGTMDEWLQWLAPTRVGEWVDVALNLFAGICGLIFALAYMPPDRLQATERRVFAKLGLLAAGSVLLFAAFFHQAHLGYRVVLPGDLEFVSWHSSDQLLELSKERAVRWASHAPGRLALIGIEDTYRSEAAFHVQYRNAALGRGDRMTAWKENRILETYYDAFLAYGNKHRWPEAQRRSIERQRKLPEPAYSSPVLVERVFVRPSKAIFWAFAVIFALSLAVVAHWSARERTEDRI